ncbi:MAG TPA: toxin HicA [Gammaproteobacteria bacterium]|nr:toxin HicA [Gammaproteobacteria bacterium]
MSGIASILEKMKQNPKGIRFSDLKRVCEHYFGTPRQSGTSHCIYRMPWPGDPRVNIQNHKGKAKPYQVRQVLLAVERLEVSHGSRSR